MNSSKSRFWRSFAVCAGACLLLVVALLSGPGATWLHCRESWAEPSESADVVYLVAGERDQDRRVSAVVQYVRDAHVKTVLVGNETTIGPWSREEQKNLTVGAWGACKVKEGLAESIESSESNVVFAVSVEILGGGFVGTDGEMEVLGRYLKSDPAIESLVIVTSPFHIRRTLNRLSRYADRPVVVMARPAKSVFRDRAPWVVLAEMGKMLRDRMGLSRAPYLSRRGWIEEE